MFPGVISGKYKIDDAAIDLFSLANRAGVSFVLAEIKALDPHRKILLLTNRNPINFSTISLDIGSETISNYKSNLHFTNNSICKIKPFCKAFAWIKKLDEDPVSQEIKPVTIVGSGHAAIEIALALRKRWPLRELQLKAYRRKLKRSYIKDLSAKNIRLIEPQDITEGPVLLCTGSQPHQLLKEAGLELNSVGRVLTKDTFQVLNHPNIFAAGDCAVIVNQERPPSGVWAVRSARPLALNLEKFCRGSRVVSWKPRKFALQLIGSNSIKTLPSAWASWGSILVGPNFLFWKVKELIDRRFIAMFNSSRSMEEHNETASLLCRGCASKIASSTLKEALLEADLDHLAQSPEDASLITTSNKGENIVQTVDGFPALLSDPWLNSRLTTLHACSDVWATGASVFSAQAVITLPQVSSSLQKELLVQCISGIQSALEPQSARLVGGHTFESRSELSDPITLGIEISLCVNGQLPSNQSPLRKDGLEPDDALLISRSLGSGILFAGAMRGQTLIADIDSALDQMSKSQHMILRNDYLKEDLGGTFPGLVHACTDITGFGLLGHLNEMLSSSNHARSAIGKEQLQIYLNAKSIPALQGVNNLLRKGITSTFADSNRSFLSLLHPSKNLNPSIYLDLADIPKESYEHQRIKELIIDPQTCGPLVIACSQEDAHKLIKNTNWIQIGFVNQV